MPSKYVEYDKSHHSGGTPEERLRYRELNSGAPDKTFAARGYDKPEYVVRNARDRIINNIRKASQSSPPDNPLQPGPDLMGRRG
jgi:hypothetical protein